MWVRLIPLFISCILLGAHFLRMGSMTVVALCLVYPVLLIFGRAWCIRAVQVVTWAGGLAWLYTMFVIGSSRMAHGEPWARMAIILGVVALWSFWAGWLVGRPAVRERVLAPAGGELIEHS